MSLYAESPLKVDPIPEDDGYVPNGYPTTTGSGFASSINHHCKVNIDDTDEDSSPTTDDGAPSKPKYTKWPQRPEQLLKHVCAQCGMEFGKEAFLTQHLDNMHNELHTAKNLKITVTSPTEGVCQICGAHVYHKTVRDLQAHHFLHLQYKSYKCKCHNYHFQDKQSGLQHLKFHAQQSMLRKLPSFETGDEVYKNANSKILEDGTAYDPECPETGVRFICPECGEEYTGEEDWKEHINSSHDFKSLEGLNMTRIDATLVRCNECNSTITCKSDNYKLRRHKVTHSPFKAFHCKLCKYGRKRKEDVVQHIRHTHTRSGEKYF